jgi:hypothetical protein
MVAESSVSNKRNPYPALGGRENTRQPVSIWHRAAASRLWSQVIMIGVFVFTVALLYGKVLALPVFFDDMAHFRWLERRTLASLWSTADAYYRSLPFIVWKVLLEITGSCSQAVLHGLNLLLHLFNGWCVASLARHFTPTPARKLAVGLLAGELFLTFPFDYQIVPWVGAMSHPLSFSLSLTAILFYLALRKTRCRLCFFFSLILTVLAPFAHQTGLVVTPLLLVMEGLRLADPIPSARVLVYLPASLPFLVIRMTIDSGRRLVLSPLEDVLRSGVFFLQGFIVPFQAIAMRLMKETTMNDLMAVIVVALVFLGPAAWLIARRGHLRFLLFSLAWFVLAVAPVILFLPYNYILDGPRLLYLSSVAVAMLGAILLVELWAWKPLSLLARTLALGWLALALFIGIRHVRERMTLHNLGGQYIWQLVETARQQPADSVLLYVNALSSLVPKTATFPIGHEGVMLWPDYTLLQDLVWINSDLIRDVRSVTFAGLFQPQSYHFGSRKPAVGWEQLVRLVRESDMVWVVDYAPHDIRIKLAGTLRSGGTEQDTGSVAVFGDLVTLTSVTYQVADGTLYLTLEWHCDKAAPANYSVFVHLVNDRGQLVDQADGYALRGLFPFWLWQQGDTIRDERTLHLSLQPRSAYKILVGIYHLETGERVPAYDLTGQPIVDAAVPVITIDLH